MKDIKAEEKQQVTSLTFLIRYGNQVHFMAPLDDLHFIPHIPRNNLLEGTGASHDPVNFVYNCSGNSQDVRQLSKSRLATISHKHYLQLLRIPVINQVHRGQHPSCRILVPKAA